MQFMCYFPIITTLWCKFSMCVRILNLYQNLMGWEGHVTCKEERVFYWKTEASRLLVRPRPRWEGNFNMDLK
jgi:hypothetical protein